MRLRAIWALAATVQNCPIRGTGTQFPSFIEWRSAEWQTFTKGVVRLGRLALRLARAEALPYWPIVVETCACRMSFCCTPTGAPVSEMATANKAS